MPRILGGCRVVACTLIDERHRRTDNCRHDVGDAALAVAGLAIVTSEPSGGFSLFYCDSDWNVIADTWHSSLRYAKEQAEFEYIGVSSTWLEN